MARKSTSTKAKAQPEPLEPVAETPKASQDAEASEDHDPKPSNLIRKKDIYDNVTVATGLRKREVREAVDATLAFLFDQLSEGREVQAPPLGKFRVIIRGEGETEKRTYKLNLAKPSDPEKDAPAVQEALEDTAE